MAAGSGVCSCSGPGASYSGSTLDTLRRCCCKFASPDLCRKLLCGQYSIERNGDKVIFKIGSSTEVLVMGSLAKVDVPGYVEFLGHRVVNLVLFCCRVTGDDAIRRLVVEFLGAFVGNMHEGRATEYTQMLQSRLPPMLRLVGGPIAERLRRRYVLEMDCSSDSLAASAQNRFVKHASSSMQRARPSIVRLARSTIPLDCNE